MNKTIIIVVLIGLMLVGVYFVVNKSQKSPASDPVQTPQATSPSTGAQKSLETSRYIVYTKAALADAANKRRVLYFYANWCPTCRPADANFKENASKIPTDVVVIRVNYNDTDTDQEEKDLAQQYGITYQHTFVQIDVSGNEVTSWNGGQIAELLLNIK